MVTGNAGLGWWSHNTSGRSPICHQGWATVPGSWTPTMNLQTETRTRGRFSNVIIFFFLCAIIQFYFFYFGIFLSIVFFFKII